MGSAVSTPTFQAVNANIANDGTADSPRGYASITSTGTFTVTKGGASLYRVAVSSPAAPITATLPTDVKAGYRVRFEVELTSSTETNCFFTSPSIAEAQINGTGFVELMAKIDNPSVAGDWKVVDVEENTTVTVTYTGAIASTNRDVRYYRRNRTIQLWHPSLSVAGNNTSANISTAGGVIPTRFRPVSDNFYLFSYRGQNNNALIDTLRIDYTTTGVIVLTTAVSGSLFTAATGAHGCLSHYGSYVI